MVEWWDKKAADLQRMSFGDYPTESGNNDDFYKLLLHTRQDVILIYSVLSSLNKQISGVRTLLMLILLVLIFIAIKPYF
jgi:hypothetical protein